MCLVFVGLHIDENTLERVLRLFFEESDWFSIVHWFEAPCLFESHSVCSENE